MGTHAAGEPAASRSFGSSRIGGIVRNLRIGSVVLLVLSAVFFTPSARPQEASDCLTCHSPAVGLKNSQGKDISVNASTHMKGAHGSLHCLDCHAGAAAESHSAKTASASCVTCHADAAKALSASAHAALGNPSDSSTCITCHGIGNVSNEQLLGHVRLSGGTKC